MALWLPFASGGVCPWITLIGSQLFTRFPASLSFTPQQKTFRLLKMRFSACLASLTGLLALTGANAAAISEREETTSLEKRWYPIAPKVMVIS